MKRTELLKVIYGAIDWRRLYELMPEVSRQEVDEFFQEVRTLFVPQPARDMTDRIAGATAVLYCDGASKGNPGPSGIGMVLATPEGQEVMAWGEAIGNATNNVAEYRAAIAGTGKALELGVRRLRVLTDSELLVEQMLGKYQVKSRNIVPLHEELAGLLAQFTGWEVVHVTRDRNTRADALAAEYARRPPGN